MKFKNAVFKNLINNYICADCQEMNWVGERAESSLLVLKVVILFGRTSWAVKNVWRRSQTYEKRTESVEVTQAAIPKRLTSAEPKHIKIRFCMSEMLLERYKKSTCCLGLWLEWNMDPLRQPQRQKLIPSQWAKSTTNPNTISSRLTFSVLSQV